MPCPAFSERTGKSSGILSSTTPTWGGRTIRKSCTALTMKKLLPTLSCRICSHAHHIRRKSMTEELPPCSVRMPILSAVRILRVHTENSETFCKIRLMRAILSKFLIFGSLRGAFFMDVRESDRKTGNGEGQPDGKS